MLSYTLGLSLTHSAFGLFLGHHPLSQQSINVIKNILPDAEAHLSALLIRSLDYISNMSRAK